MDDRELDQRLRNIEEALSLLLESISREEEDTAEDILTPEQIAQVGSETSGKVRQKPE